VKLLALAGGTLAFFFAMRAEAACQGRPTDASGYLGYSYTGATVKSFAGARTRVHYATSGMNMVDLATTRGDGVPDSVALVADIGDKSFVKYAEMGFKQPPSDTACASHGDDDKLDVYLVAFTGADGTTAQESCVDHTCSSFVLVESTFSGRGYPSAAEGFRTVVAHELFHAVQNGYDADMDRFWAEGTAQWAMKQVYPELVDFERQLPAFFKDNTRSLDTQPSGVTAGFLYGSSVWPLFLTLRHGPDTVKDIFERELDGTKALDATELVLMTKQATLATDYPIFGAYNAATKALGNDGGGYPDSAKYPGVKTETLADGATAISSGLSYFVYRGTLDALSNISLEGDPARIGGIVVPIEDGKVKLASSITALPANATGEVLVVVAGTTTKKSDAPFTIRIGPPQTGPAQPPGGVSPGDTPGDGGADGGCSVTPSPATPSTVLTTLAVALALTLSRARARARARTRIS
jgi:hypothetical protein